MENSSYPWFLYNIYNNEKYYLGEPVNIYIQSLINMIQDKNWLITTKKGKGKSPLFCGNGERVMTIYAIHSIVQIGHWDICVVLGKNKIISWTQDEGLTSA